MKDLHTHVLPGIDDGAATPKESIEMLVDSFNQGVTFCALTPHCVIHNPDDIPNFLKLRQLAYEEIKDEIVENKIPEIALGAEVYADHDVSEHDDIESLRIEGTNYILLELPFISKYDWLGECVYSLNLKGLTVILAHIDRYPFWHTIIRELAGLDVVYQINASRFLRFRERIFVKKLLKTKQRFVVSSDMHNMSGRRCNIEKAFSLAYKVSKDAEKMFWK